MANLYRFVICDNKVVYSIAKNWKTARNLVYHTYKTEVLSLIDIVGKRVKTNCNEAHGIYADDYVFQNHPWWECRCGNDKSFIAINGGMSARCTECGREIYLRGEF